MTSYAQDIKPLFTERDRESMLHMFDLWSYDDVSSNADSILGVLEAGTMPCYGAWAEDKVGTFRDWAQGGKPA